MTMQGLKMNDEIMETNNGNDSRLTSDSTIFLEGTWTIERAPELRELLMEAAKTAEEVLIDVRQVKEVDLSCLQLLCSAHRTFAKRGAKLALHEDRSEAFEKAVRDAGYHNDAGCGQNYMESCLWKGGWKQWLS